MIERRPFGSLGNVRHRWLDARHHFSFAQYRDPDRMGWGSLRAWSDNSIKAGAGFPLHPHAGMEIVTYVHEGAITHQDSLGNKGRAEAGDVQVMSSGTGLYHSEYNLEPNVAGAFQIWIIPDRYGEPPAWKTTPFPRSSRSGRLTVLASGMDGDRNSLPIRANARVLGAALRAGESVNYQFGANRYGYLASTAGKIEVNGVALQARDGAAICDIEAICISASEDAELVLVDSSA